MTGISRKLPDTERARLKRILRDVVPESAGVIVRTAAEGASEEELRADVERLTTIWERIKAKADSVMSGRKGKGGGSAPMLVHGEPDMTVRVIRDVFNEDFTQLVVSGDDAWTEVSDYVASVAPDLAPRLLKWTGEGDIFGHYRIHEQIAKAMDRKVWLPSGGSLVIDRTEAMTVVDVNTGKFVGSGGNLEETVTRNNIEAAEEIVRQLRLRDIGGIIVIDFIDMVLESNRDLVVRRLLECLGRDRTKHQVAEVTSLGLVQMTRKRVGSGLIEVFSDSCEHCNGRGYIIHTEPIERPGGPAPEQPAPSSAQASAGQPSARSRSRRGRSGMPAEQAPAKLPVPAPGGPTPAQIAAAAHAAAMKSSAAGETPEAAEAAEASVASEAAVAAVAAEASEAPTAPELPVAPDAQEATPTVGSASVESASLESSTESSTESSIESSIEQAAAPDVSAAADATEGDGTESPVTTPPTPAAATVAPVSGRARRRRGRVVAPAGPPRLGDGSDPAS
jgi:ribonuclease E